MVQLDDQTGHLDDEAKVEKNDPNSSLLSLASLSIELLLDTDQMDIPASKDPLPIVNLDLPSTKISPPKILTSPHNHLCHHNPHYIC